MYTVRINSQLEDRLDAEFYNPEALKTMQKIDALGKTKRLGQLIADGYRVVYHGKDSINGIPEERLLPFLSPTQIDDQGSIDFSAADKLPLYYKDDYPKGLAVAGELLIEVKGNVSKVGVVPEEFPKHLMVSGSLYKASFKADTNSRYVLAFLKSKHGQTLKNRLTSNTIINYIAKDALYSIPLFEANSDVQKYIGDKVRQAERLRAWAKAVVDAYGDIFSAQYPPLSNYKKYRSKHFRMDLGSNFDVLTPESYPPEIGQYFRENKFLTLGELASEIFTGNTQDGADPGHASVSQATSRSCTGQFLRKPFNQVIKPKVGKYLKKLDILLTCGAHDKKYIGKDVSIYHDDEDNLPSSKVLVVRIKEGVLPASYVHSYLKSDAGYIQWQSVVRGISAGIHPGDVARIRIPVPIGTKEWHEKYSTADEIVSLAGKACEVATQLTHTAKLLVEALIEGQITEAELISAEQALQAGNDQLDGRILNRLKTDGVDGQGPALFGDLDELYQLLTQAEGD